MKKVNIGYIYSSSKQSVENKLFFKISKKKNINLILFNVSKEFEEIEIEKKPVNVIWFLTTLQGI